MQTKDRVREDIKKPIENWEPDPITAELELLNPDGWEIGTIEKLVLPEPCSACGHALKTDEPRWRVEWDNGRDTEQYESTLVLFEKE